MTYKRIVIFLNLYNLFKKIYHKLFGKYKHCLLYLLSKEIDDEWTILDVGCGRCSPLKEIKKESYKVGLDHYEPYISKSKEQSIHNKYVLGDVRALPFKYKTFECAIATEVLEHLNKEDGLKMLQEMERVAKRKIILTTPNGFLRTYAGPEDNPEETHLCGYTVDELKKIGFKVYGFNGLKVLWTIRNGKAVLRFRVYILFVYLSGVFVYYFPQFAFQLFFFKKM